ncbi:uncharacterized protein LOC144098234 [Amblyomma americanum]
MLCGDVELNPGPETDSDSMSAQEMLKQLILGQQKLTDEMAALRAHNAKMEKMFCEFTQQLDLLKDQSTRVENLEKTVTFLREKIIDLEDRSRRSNLVVFGVDEASDETESVLREKVISEVFQEKLGVTCNSVARIHRIGKAGKKRPVILFFQDFNEKQEVMRNVRKLKGTKYSVQNDYSRDTLRIRKLLWDSTKIDRDQGKKPILVHDKLKIDGQIFAWDEANNCRIKIRNEQSKE